MLNLCCLVAGGYAYKDLFIVIGIIMGVMFAGAIAFTIYGTIKSGIYFWVKARNKHLQRLHDLGETKEYQNEVRRTWLRGLHAFTGDEGQELRCPRAVWEDADMSQMLQFFHKYPGLRRQVGGTIALYYAPRSSPRFFGFSAL